MDFSKKGKNPSFLSSRYVVLTEEWTCLFVDKVVLKNTEHPTQEMVADRKQFSFPRFTNIWRVINTDSLYLAKKYPLKFILEHYLFLEVHSFPPVSFSENFAFWNR